MPLLFAVPAHAASGIPADREIRFEILRGNAPIGTHSLKFTPKPGGKTQVDIAIDMDVYLGPIKVFTHTRRNTELWRGNAPLRVASTTDDDGKDYKVNARWQGGVVLASVGGQDAQLNGRLLPSSYWNPKTLKAEALLNTQTGEEKPIRVTDLGPAQVETAIGPLDAQAYRIDAAFPITISYDKKTGQWVGLSFRARGALISYRRLDPL